MTYCYSKNDDTLEPIYNGCQLIGDSQFVRFSEQILKKQRKRHYGIAYIGLCVSGQKIIDLIRRIEQKFYPISQCVVVMIGTNDLLQKTPVREMCVHIETLVFKLIENGVQELILLTIPPVPRFAKSYDHWNRLKNYNHHIRSLHNGEDIFVIDAYTKFVKNSERRCNSLDTTKKENLINESILVKPLFSSIKTSAPEQLPVKLALRISLTEGQRTVYIMDNKSINNTKYKYYNTSHSSSLLRSVKHSKLTSYQTIPSNEKFDSLADDDHNDRFGEEDITSYNNDIVDEINYHLFEEYFSRSNNRKDWIHFNLRGLNAIRELISCNVRFL